MFARLRSAASAAASFVAAATPSVARDLIGFMGFASISYGTWLINEGTGFIVGGVLAVATAALLSVRT